MQSAWNNGWLLDDVSNLMLAALYFNGGTKEINPCVRHRTAEARYLKKQNKAKQLFFLSVRVKTVSAYKRSEFRGVFVFAVCLVLKL